MPPNNSLERTRHTAAAPLSSMALGKNQDMCDSNSSSEFT